MPQQSKSARSPLGIVSAVIPLGLIATVAALVLGTDGLNTNSSAFRFAGLTGLFLLGIGTGLGIVSLMRAREDGTGRLPALAGITLSVLIFLVLSLSVLRARPATAASGSAAPAEPPGIPGMVEDRKDSTVPPRFR